MYDLNKTTLTGRPSKDGEVRVTQSGKHVMAFSFAVSNGRDKDGKDRPATWYNLVAWEKVAEAMKPWVQKGKPLYIECRYQPRSYEDNGVKKTASEFVITDFKPMFQLPKPEQTSLGYGGKDIMGYTAKEPEYHDSSIQIDTEDLPFY